MKIVLALFVSILFVISSTNFTSANLNRDGDFSSISDHEKSDLYCGLPLPVEGGQGGQGEETNSTDETDENQQGQDNNSGSETDSGSQSDQEN